MRWAIGLLVGFVLASACENRCADPVDCDTCRACASETRGACIVAWRACSTDPRCNELVICVDDCYFVHTGSDAVRCERSCRGHIGGTAVDLYDEWTGCIDDACTLDCE